jgi:hypothetical protein
VIPEGAPFQRLHGPRDVVMEHGIELRSEPGLEIVAEPLRIGSVDDTDGPLQPGRFQRGSLPQSVAAVTVPACVLKPARNASPG